MHCSLLLSSFMALLEVVGIASILPFMQLVAEPDAITQNEWLNWVYVGMGFETPREMLISTGVMVLLLLLIANGFAAFTRWLQQKTAWDTAHRISCRLVKFYLHQPYKYFLKHNTSDLLSNAVMEVGELITGVFLPLIELISRLLVTAVIFGLLLWTDYSITLMVILVLGSTYALIYLARRHFLARLGKDRIEANMRRFRTINELLTGQKTFRVYNVQDFFFRRYEQESKAYSNIKPRVFLVSASARYIIEVIAFGGILAITLYLIITVQNLAEILPLLSLFAFAGYRLLPSLQGAFSALTTLRHSYPVVEKLHGNLQKALAIDNLEAPDPAQAFFTQELKISGTTFYYDDTTEPVVSDLRVRITKGKTVAFVGTTGSGKTTVVDMIVGLLWPQDGNISVDNMILSPDNVHKWQRLIGYVPQEVFLFDDTVKRNIAIGTPDDKIDFDLLRKVARIANIDSFITSEMPDGYDSLIGERGVRLSGGQRQRLGLARALYRQPQVLVLDEATSALDSITESAVIEALKAAAEDLTVIIIAHRLSTVRHADCIYVLKDSELIAEGTYDELMNTSETFQEMAKLS